MAETPPFTLSGWMLSRAEDRARLLYVYLNRLKHAKNMEDRMLAHAEFLGMQLERYGAVAKSVSEAMTMATTMLGGFAQIYRHRQNLEEMARRNELEKQTTERVGPPKRRRLPARKRLTRKLADEQ